MARTETLLRIVRELWFDANNVYLWIRKLQACGDTADQSASAYRTENRLDIRQIFENLQGDGALASDDLFVVVGRDDLVMVWLREFFGFGFALVTSRVRRRRFRHRRREWLPPLYLGAFSGMTIDRFRAEFAGGICHTLGMIAAGVADNAMTALLHGQGGDLVERAANLNAPIG